MITEFGRHWIFHVGFMNTIDGLEIVFETMDQILDSGMIPNVR